MTDKKKSDKPAVVLDKRLIDRQIDRGNISREEFQAHLGSLPDLEAQADDISSIVYPQDN